MQKVHDKRVVGRLHLGLNLIWKYPSCNICYLMMIQHMKIMTAMFDVENVCASLVYFWCFGQDPGCIHINIKNQEGYIVQIFLFESCSLFRQI